MISNEGLIKFTKNNYPEEDRVIIRSMINYYVLKLKSNKSAIEISFQETLYDGVIDLFKTLSELIGFELVIDPEIIFTSLKNIHIKT